MKKLLSIGIILLFIFSSIPIAISNTPINHANTTDDTPVKIMLIEPLSIGTYYPSDDVEISHRSPDVNFNINDNMRCRNDYGYVYEGPIWASDDLLKFDISDIPIGSIVVNSSLSLYYFKYISNDPAGRPLTIYRLLDNWNEDTVTWNNQPSSLGFATDVEDVPSSTGTWMSWDVTDDVEDFVDDPYFNYGWKIMDETKWGDAAIPDTFFWTKEYGSFIPYLEVEYIEGDSPTTPLKPTGPINLAVYQTASFETVSTDIDSDTIKYGWDWDGDRFVDHWTNYYKSGEVVEISHSWNLKGTYNIGVKAEDINGFRSGFSIPLTVTITDPNEPPYTPDMPIGETSLLGGEIGEYITYCIDPDNDNIRMGWDWNGDDTVNEWTEYYSSAQTIIQQHVWNEPGSYDIKVKAEDFIGAQSEFSESLTVLVIVETNDPPETPSINGETNGESNVSYVYNINSQDPDNDQVFYILDWGDGNISDWLGPYNSGVTQDFSHMWKSEGSYIIRVKAKDVNDLESDWGTLEVSMPKQKPFQFFIEQFLEIHPIIYQILQLII